jgi:hypothetical protein
MMETRKSIPPLFMGGSAGAFVAAGGGGGGTAEMEDGALKVAA